MTKEIPPLYRPDNLPPPQLKTVEKIRDDGTIKEREVWRYCSDDKTRQRYALDLLRKAHVISKYSTGGQPGMRLMHNVMPHIRGMESGEDRAFYLLDLKKAFPNVDRNEATLRFYGLIGRKGVDLTSLEREYLEIYMHEEVGAFLNIDGDPIPGVPQGNATSGAMLDILLNDADYRVGRSLASVGGVYTRFIDDLTFSVPASRKTGKFPESTRKSVRYTFSEIPGVVLNDEKTQRHSPDEIVTITGITISRDGLRAPSRGILKHAQKSFDAISELIREGGEITEHDVNVFDGYRGALAIAGRPDKSPSQEVRTLYNRSIRLGNILYEIAAAQGVLVKPRSPLVHAAAQRRRETYKKQSRPKSVGLPSVNSERPIRERLAITPPLPTAVAGVVLPDVATSEFIPQPSLFDDSPETIIQS